MMSGNWYCDVSHRRRRDLEAPRPDHDLPEHLRRRVLLRPDRHLRAEHRPVRLVPAIRKATRAARAPSGSRSRRPDRSRATRRPGPTGTSSPATSASPQATWTTPTWPHRGRSSTCRPTSFPQAGGWSCGSRCRSFSGGGTINYGYTDPTKSTTAWGAHLVQQTRSQAVWCGPPGQLDRRGVHDAGRRQHLLVVHRSRSPHGPTRRCPRTARTATTG